MAVNKKNATIWCNNPNHNGTCNNKVKTPKVNCNKTINTKKFNPFCC